MSLAIPFAAVRLFIPVKHIKTDRNGKLLLAYSKQGPFRATNSRALWLPSIECITDARLQHLKIMQKASAQPLVGANLLTKTGLLARRDLLAQAHKHDPGLDMDGFCIISVHSILSGNFH